MKTSQILVNAALVGILGAAFAATSARADDKTPAGTDSGKPAATGTCTNSCKGKGNCKTAANACKGQNGCKGQGAPLTATDKKSCKAAKGVWTPAKA